MGIKNTGCNIGLWFACMFLFPLQAGAKAGAGYAAPADTTLQHVAIKTNLLHDVTATLNLGAEFTLSERFSLDVPLSWNPWKFGSDRHWKHFLVQPELRWWKEPARSGHFFGLHAHYGIYNVSRLPDFLFSDYMSSRRFDGWLAGAGVSYGYRWNLNPKWSLEATVGLGYAYMDYDRYEAGDPEKVATGTYNYLGPTRLGITLGYTLGGKNTTKVKQTHSAYRTTDTYYPPAAAEKRESRPEREAEVQVQAEIQPQQQTEPQIHPQIEAQSQTVPARVAPEERTLKGTAYLDYAQGSAAIDYDFGNNMAELRKVHDLIESILQNPYSRITKIALVGHASPEGSATDNMLLSADRAVALKDHLKIVHSIPESAFTVDGRGEDWHTIDSLVAASDDIKKYLILEIIRGTRDADERERRLCEEWPGLYERLRRETYPHLRRIEYEITYVQLTIDKGQLENKH